MSISFSSHFKRSEQEAVEALLADFDWPKARATRVRKKASTLVEAVRVQKRPMGQLEAFLQDYALDTEEGLALMTLAEALLRVPDKATAKTLIRDKVAAANWLESKGSSKDWVVKAAGVGLFMTSKTLDGVLSRIGEPVVREAMVKAMRILGKQFVLGRDIEEAFQNALPLQGQGYRMSYDILGEAACTAADAQRYYESYEAAIRYIGERVSADDVRQPGISVKLSALHPRYEYAQKERCVPEMAERVHALATLAAQRNLGFTIDAEESERLNLSVEIIEAVLEKMSFKDWDGFGLAVQAYHKAAPAVIDHMAALADKHNRRIQMRLVKGAYWDSEIKKAQVDGVEDFPVYTRKSHTDMAYMACASKIFSYGDHIYPMFGTHNAHTMAAILEMGKKSKATYEFQRLFGMGQGLFDAVLEDEGKSASVYAPVGPHEDLLPYLVRRLLENGANTSFVNRLLDPAAPVDELVGDPVDKCKNRDEYKHPKIRLPKDLYADEKPQGRINSAGVDLHAPEDMDQLVQAVEMVRQPYKAAPLIAGQVYEDGTSEDITNPADDDDHIGQVYTADTRQIEKAFETARDIFPEWAGSDANVRASALEHAADLLEQSQDEFIALLVREAGKTIPDALAEIREAVDFCRYYAAQGRDVFQKEGAVLSGPTGESNRLNLYARGTFVCISPWNFPLAIFTGQIAAALMAGNAVLAKPAEQTPLIATRMVEIMHEAGVPAAALNLLPGAGRVGAILVEHPDVAGVAFTGSSEVARDINRALAAKNGPIVPLIAETGGQNAMIVDSSALPEQVIKDVITSAFGSAGQRCSALRVLCLQDDIADKMIRMLKGAMQELMVGEPTFVSSDVGPVIDEEALSMLKQHRRALDGFGRLISEVELSPALEKQGHFFGPCAFEIQNLGGLTREVFGPVLHVLRYKAEELDDVLEQIRDTKYGLTLGVHSRIESFQNKIIAQMPVGNVYVNRSMIGAVVGAQPFGGMGLSGTGPKAGGPHYLQRFATEKVVSIDTTAAGGNASLVSLGE